jgi:two-component system CheB/CheR fusion protein
LSRRCIDQRGSRRAGGAFPENALGRAPLIWVGLAVAVLVADIAVAYRNTERLVENDRWVAHTHEVVGELQALLQAVAQTAAGQRGYLLTGTDRSRSVYEAQAGRVAQHLSRLRDLTADNPSQQERLNALDAQVKAQLERMHDNVEQRGRPGGTWSAPLLERNLQEMQAISSTVAEMDAREQALLHERSLQSERSAGTLTIALALMTALGIGLVTLAALAARRSADAIHRERAWLSVTLRSIGDAVIATDPEGRVTFANRVAQTLTGWHEDEARGQPLDKVFHILHEETRESVATPVTRVLREGTVIGLGNHTVLVSKDGTRRPIDDSAAPIRGPDGAVAGVILVFRDVTERRKLDRLERDMRGELERQVRERTAQLHASEERFRLLVEGTKDYGIFMLNPEGHVTSWNPGAERICGYGAQEIVGEHFSRFYTPEDVQAGKPQRALAIAAVEGRWEEEGWRVRKDGSRFWASALITALRGETGNLSGFSKITRDISRRKEAEETAHRLLKERAAREAAEGRAEAIREEKEWLRVTLQSIGDAVVAVDPEGRVTLMNPIAEALTGWTMEQATGRPLDKVFVILNEETRRPAENPVARVLREGVVVGLANHTLLVARDGTERPIDDSAAPILYEPGEVAGVILVFRDVTDKRRQDREREKLLREAREADQRKDEFLATLGHELRNPLAPLRNALHLIRMRAGDESGLDDVMAMMDRQVGHLVRLVDDLLDISRITRGKIELRRERVEVGEVLGQALEAVQPLLEERRHQVELDVPPDALVVEGDRVRLAQVFGNLLTNAAKYSEPDGRICVAAGRQGDDIVVTIRDTGIGIEPEMLDRIFDIFQQSRRTTGAVGEGLGIGLTLVRNLVALHGGTVNATSGGAGRGSEFTVRLPVAEDAPARRPQTGSDSDASAQPLRVLVVDDNADAANSLAALLQLQGHEVRVSNDAATALEIARSLHPQVALLDIALPGGMDGYTLARRLREEPSLDHIRLIAVTGYGQEADRQRAMQAGFDVHLTKPADPEELRRTIMPGGGHPHTSRPR